MKEKAELDAELKQETTPAPEERGEERLESDLEVAEEQIEAETPSVVDTAEYQELHQKYLRLYAEFENFRRRSAHEAIENIERAEWKVLEKLLGVVDNFERAIEGGAGEDAEALFKGMELIYGQFKELLKGFGLEPFGTVGEQFDPHLHDALMSQPSDEQPEGCVVSIFERGYAAKGRVLRHAKVVVSTGACESEQESEKE